MREWIEGGASERCALAAIGMSASALRYRPREDRNVELREYIVALAHRHRRYGVGMIYLNRLAHSRGLPKVIRTDNGKEFCGKAMVAWAHANCVQLRQIQPGKPNQNAYVESFNGRLREECLNEHWFPTLLHARTEIERWSREYNEHRPKKAIGAMTPATYAKQLANSDIINTGL
ncbi:hypothetical protein ADT26_17160 [Xanthomonas oryzae]|nr:hypothetical protein AXO1947_17610 [Xanthomonas oryzae pv. oryzae]KOR40698.1 hypothetical protein ADT26_17160 [Xanthomonas oryzae]AUI89468.1 transposase [Xanthomonas oryzae pv. oryzae]AUI93144.1 transposase [Xanthomonas oryzae pv. oryzae]AUI96816.1 transposase [Xanthomonas oryzae pv. oryzae]